MKLKKRIIVSYILIILIFPVGSYAQNPYDNIGCCGWAILIPAYIITSWIDGIENLIDNVGDSRTINVDVKGVKGSFQRNSVVDNKSRKGGILKGNLTEKIEVTIREKKMKILPGEIIFYENGNIAKCLISSSELYAGNNAVVNCTGFVEFYDDELVKSTILQNDSCAEAELFNIQGEKRKLTAGISFYQNGNVEECRLKSESVFTIADYSVSIPGETNLQFSEKSKLIFIKPVYNKRVSLKYKNELLSLYSDIFLYENGKLKHCELDESIIIQNGRNKLRVKGKIAFYDNEMIDECRMINPVSIEVNKNIIEFDKSENETLSFYKNGNVKEGKIPRNKKQYYVHGGNRFRIDDGSSVKFYEDGSIMSLVPYKNTILNIGNERIILYDDSIRFYKDGEILSLHSAGGTEYNYQGSRLYVNNYSEKLFFNRKQELIIFNNDKGQTLQINGKAVFVPSYVKVSYSDYNSKIVDFVGIVYSGVTLPPHVTIAEKKNMEYVDIFVKAKNFFTNESKDKLYARDIQEIMFSEDTMITVYGIEHFCREMEWFKIPLKK